MKTKENSASDPDFAFFSHSIKLFENSEYEPRSIQLTATEKTNLNHFERVLAQLFCHQPKQMHIFCVKQTQCTENSMCLMKYLSIRLS